MNDKLMIEKGKSAVVTLSFDQPKVGTNPNGAWFMYGVKHNGADKVFFATDKCHEKLSKYKKGDSVKISHVDLGDTSVYNVEPSSDNSNQSNNNDKDTAIKWGMAFNNATRLVAHMDATPSEKTSIIKEVMPIMFDIACSMPNEEEEVELPF